jgi:hypothetical protein
MANADIHNEDRAKQIRKQVIADVEQQNNFLSPEEIERLIIDASKPGKGGRTVRDELYPPEETSGTTS